MGKLSMLDPRADVLLENHPPVPGLDDLTGKVVGILDNGQANSSPMFEELARLIEEQTGAAEVLLRKKPSHMNAAPGEMIEEMLSRCDAVVTGLGA
ncbi:MAG: hypothetical protein OXK20_09100 [Deltaproteobacteria bacterium]|nr:hypothetical protein [Deltaproteobacteria bacterium]